MEEHMNAHRELTKSDCSNAAGQASCRILAQAGLRITRHRRMVYDLLRESDQPISTEALFLVMKKDDSQISLSTVYRILEAFLEKNLIERVGSSDEGKVLYAIVSQVHCHHLHCLSCHRITVVEGCPLGEYEGLIEKTTRFHVTGHKLELMGYCATCMQDTRHPDEEDS